MEKRIKRGGGGKGRNEGKKDGRDGKEAQKEGRHTDRKKNSSMETTKNVVLEVAVRPYIPCCCCTKMGPTSTN